MLEKIEKVGDNYEYLHENYQYARVTFFKDYMNVKQVILKGIEFYPLFDREITLDEIKSFYKACINEKWNMDIKDFKKRYENLVDLVLYDNCLIMLKFERKKYYEFFNIEKGYTDPLDNLFSDGNERLFAPYSLKLELEYTTLSDKTEKENMEFIFKNYIDDFLVVKKIISNHLTIRTEPLCIPDYIILLKNNDEKNLKNKWNNIKIIKGLNLVNILIILNIRLNQIFYFLNHILIFLNLYY